MRKPNRKHDIIEFNSCVWYRLRKHHAACNRQGLNKSHFNLIDLKSNLRSEKDEGASCPKSALIALQLAVVAVTEVATSVMVTIGSDARIRIVGTLNENGTSIDYCDYQGIRHNNNSKIT
jgi:hypothetical protein